MSMLEKFHEQNLAAALNLRSGAEQNDAWIEFISFRVSGQEFLIDLAEVLEISQTEHVTTVPHAGPYIEGLFVSRSDEITPLVDIGRVTGLAGFDSEAKKDCCLIVSCRGERFAIRVDEVIGLLKFQRVSVEASRTDIFATGCSVVSGVVKDAGCVRPVVDVQAVFHSVFSAENKNEIITH